MNTILTDDERRAAIKSVRHGMFTEPVPDDVARAVEAAVLAKLAQQEPVAWMRPSGNAMLEEGRSCTVYASEGMSIHSVPLYAHPAAQQADRQRVPDDLKNRCVEILGWQKTGVLTGNALREFAKQKYGDDPHALQQAESETAREAYRVITAAPEAPAQRKKVGDSRFESWFSEDFDPKNKGTKQQMREAYEAGMNDPESAPAQASAVDERAAFEAWYVNSDGLGVSSAWGAWQARAALAQKAQA